MHEKLVYILYQSKASDIYSALFLWTQEMQ